jgi:hypothetical protein
MSLSRKLSLLAFACSSLWAAESPFIGIWKENVEKSIYFNQPATQSAEIRIESAGDKGVKITQELVIDGKKSQSVQISGLGGMEGQPAGPAGPGRGATRSFRLVSPNVWERTLEAPGDTRHGYWAVSRDGKTLIITGFGKNPSGQEYYFHRLLERQ